MQKVGNELLPLTSLRFLAALYVFVFHIHLRWPIVGPGHLDNILSQGAVGMSVFFILSGYILSHRYHDEKFGLDGYFLSRFVRIYPVYLLAAALTIPWLVTSLANNSQDLLHFVAKGLFLIVANALLVQAWFPQMFVYWNDGGSWSISTEAFFYLLFPGIIKILKQLSHKKRLIVASLFYVLSASIAFIFLAFEEKPSPPTQIFYAMPIFRLPEFVIGICAFLISKRFKAVDARDSDVYIIIFVNVAILYLGLFGNALPLYISHNWLVVPVIACLICLLGRGKGFVVTLMSAKPLVFGGRISYCFYSFQAPIVLLLLQFHDQIVQRVTLLADNRILLAITFLILVTMSTIGYIYVEEPARKGLRVKINSSSP